MSKATSENLKQLKAREATLAAELKTAKNEQSLAGQKVTLIEKKLSGVRNEITNSTPKKITVTDHALMRLMERRYGVNMDALREEIVLAVEKFGDMGNCKVPVANGLRAVLRDKTVVTVEPA